MSNCVGIGGRYVRFTSGPHDKSHDYFIRTQFNPSSVPTKVNKLVSESEKLKYLDQVGIKCTRDTDFDGYKT